MKHLYSIFAALFIGITCFSCQETIDVDLPETQERLVVDALMRIPHAETFLTEARLRLTLTAEYFADSVPTVNDALVNLNNSENTFTLNSQGNGFYSNTIPRDVMEQDSLRLTIFYNDEVYISDAKFIPAVPINSIIQGDGSLFSGDETEVIINYTDAQNQDDFYLFDLDLGNYLTSEDTFYKNQDFSFSYFYEDLNPQDTVNIKLMGIDKSFFDYMSIIINQSGQASGNPFTAPPSEIRGNVTNETDENNYPLGYFIITQTYSESIIIE
ncbi:DUF4249 family protein [Leeuwenhoekiella marinoflava]|uniref:DUF4249 family protein n=1 Tax=Leeuwenhoekiella marinoflava TaxID=988 RepID=UPI003002348B